MNKKKLLNNLHQIKSDYKFALGYPVNRQHSFNINNKLLGFTKGSVINTFLNHIGTPEVSGKFITDNMKQIEVKLVKTVAKHLNIKDNVFGFVTNGGTEANYTALWWHREYLKAKTNYTPCLICSDKSHYSVRKIANQLNLEIIYVPSLSSGMSIGDIDNIIESIKFKSIIFWINIGTTVDGIIDDAINIHSLLIKSKSTFKIHADAAIYGLLLPYIQPYNDKNIFDYIDSISISGHKFLGATFPSGLLLTKADYISSIINCNTNDIHYLADINDVSFSGSRSGYLSIELYYLLKQALKIKKNKTNLERKWFKCLKRTEWFVASLNGILGSNNLISYNPGQINVVIPAPHSEYSYNYLATKYRLMPVQNDKFCISIIPRSRKRVLKSFINDYKIHYFNC